MARRPVNATNQEARWMNATWMPHVSLSQTSHVSIFVRSAFVRKPNTLGGSCNEEEDWQIQIQLHGTAGLPLFSVCSMVSNSVLKKRNNEKHSHRTEWSKDSDTCQPSVSNFTHSCDWNQLVNIPTRWRDLPRDSFLSFRIIGANNATIYEASLPFFDKFGRLCSGLQRLDLQPSSHTSIDVTGSQSGGSSTPMGTPKGHPTAYGSDQVWKASLILDKLTRLQDSAAASNNKLLIGQIPSVPWLDKISAAHCKSVILDEAKINHDSHIIDQSELPPCLIVEFPAYLVPVMHEESFYALSSQGASGSISPLEFSIHQKTISGIEPSTSPSAFSPLDMVPFLDQEGENVFEDKYRTLAHDLLRGLVDPALKPDRLQRDRLATIIASPSHHPTREEKDLLWRFRFSLVDNRRALTKFLLAVDWTVEGEVVQAAELLEQWRMRSPIEVTDALKLLGKQVAYQTNLVRAYAIDTLASAPDNELRLYLLQLVQALKYENHKESNAGHGSVGMAPTSSLGTFLIMRASKNLQLANYLYWYLKVELQDPAYGARYREVFSELQQKLSQTPLEAVVPPNDESADHASKNSRNPDGKNDSVKSSLKSIVSSVSKLGVSLVGTDQQTAAARKEPVHQNKSPKRSMWDVLASQDVFISGIMDVQLRSRDTRGKKDAKEAALIELLAEEGFDVDASRQAMPIPSAPNMMTNGVSSSTAKMFKSALYPALLEFNVVSMTPCMNQNQDIVHDTKALPTSYKVILKTGDDLRQDQLVIMMIQLMDGLLKRATLDLCLTPYSIIATSPTSGLVDFVHDSIPVSAILAKHNNSIMQFFKACAPQAGTKYEVRPDVLSAYIRSCAGYCVITYLLGVGDRHLDNILITTAGHFFHIDFGFMFGRDPKPLPPPFRLTREMVEGMGGPDSTEYRQFCSLSCQAFNALRKSAGLVLNLLHLMSDAGIEDLSNNPTADPDGVIAKVEERFRLDLTDEKAERFFLGLINDSLTALAPRVMDVFHSIAVARR